MKKILSLLLVFTMLLSLAACGDNDPGGNDPGTKESVPAVSYDTDTLEGIQEGITADFTATTERLTKEWESVRASIGDTYDGYVKNQQALLDWYDLVQNETTALYGRTRESVVAYYKLVVETVEHEYDTIEDATDEIYDTVYEDCFDDLYDAIYEDIYDEIYDAYYEGILDDAKDSMEYGDWLDIRSDFYGTWLDVRSDFYGNWLDARSDFYGTWLDVRSASYSGNYDIDAIIAGTEPDDSSSETKETKPSATEGETTGSTDNTEANGIRPEFKTAMDEYEAFFDQYVEFMIAFKESEDVASMMGEYNSMMTQYAETMAALGDIDESELSEEEAMYYAEVMLRINQKLLQAA